MMKTIKYIIISFILTLSIPLIAKDYNASLFHINRDGKTLNTRSIQFAIDHISKNGGGRLIFQVGRYLTGTIYLKSNVTLHLAEGAVILGSVNPFEYDKQIEYTGLILARNERNIGITGKGIIDGQGRMLAENTINNVHSGLLKDGLSGDRSREHERAMTIYFRECDSITIHGITLRNSASWVQTYDQCKNIDINDITVDSKAYWNNDGIDIVDCENVTIRNSFIDVADDGICLKSHERDKLCSNILIKNNVVRSSASGIKFGTASKGGFRNVNVINNTVFDTYRSAIALESVDGGILEDVLIDSLKSVNTGNAIFIRLGKRDKSGKSTINRVIIRNVIADIPAHKPDEEYEYEGPVEHMPRNISPIVIAGIKGEYIHDLTLSNIEIKFPGGGNELFAYAALDKLDKIPELPEKYPEFSMFGELPAWGLYIRHVKNINVTNVKLSAEKKDYRIPIVLDDVHYAKFKNILIEQVNKSKGKLIYDYKSSHIETSL